MRLNRPSAGDNDSADSDLSGTHQARSSPVRISILCPELIVLLTLLGIGGTVMGIFRIGRSIQCADFRSLRSNDQIVMAVCYGADGRTLVSCGSDKQVRIWDVDEGKPDWGTEIQTLAHDWPLYSVAMTRDGKYLAAGGGGGLTIWSQKNSTVWKKVKEQKGRLYRMLAFSPDGRTLALVCSDLTIRLWDMAAMAELRELRGVADDLRAVDFSSDGGLLAASTFAGELRLWDLTTKHQEPIKGRIPSTVRSFVFLPGSRSLAITHSGDEVNGLSIWNTDSAPHRDRGFLTVTGKTSCLQFHPTAGSSRRRIRTRRSGCGTGRPVVSKGRSMTAWAGSGHSYSLRMADGLHLWVGRASFNSATLTRRANRSRMCTHDQNAPGVWACQRFTCSVRVRSAATTWFLAVW